MVVYTHEKGVGRSRVIRNNMIKSYEDIVCLDEDVSKHESFKVIITDFKLLRTFKN